MFEWDPVKAAVNLEKHGVSFDEAATVFEDALAVFVSHRELRENIRIISARLATPFERKRHEQHTRF
jgi:uncharacterized protein